jgi:hypothetical protein
MVKMLGLVSLCPRIGESWRLTRIQLEQGQHAYGVWYSASLTARLLPHDSACYEDLSHLLPTPPL